MVELVDDFDGSTYRAVYTVKFESAVLCPPRVPEEITQGNRDAEKRHRPREGTTQAGRRSRSHRETTAGREVTPV